MGEKTPHNIFYKPSLGAKGEAERVLFNTALDTADALLYSASGTASVAFTNAATAFSVAQTGSSTASAAYAIALVGSAKAGFVDRGDAAAYDFNVGDFTTDGGVYDLDLSAIVPAGAKAVYFTLVIRDGVAGSAVEMRKKGNSNWFNRPALMTQVANVSIYSDFIISCDTNRTIEYTTSAVTFDALSFVVKGWFI